jgi:hypothetical protein
MKIIEITKELVTYPPTVNSLFMELNLHLANITRYRVADNSLIYPLLKFRTHKEPIMVIHSLIRNITNIITSLELNQES